MKLFLDDYRMPKDGAGLVDGNKKIYFENDWVVVKSYVEFVDWITKNGLPEFISFDHDLSDEHYRIDFIEWYTYSADQLGVEETGLDCARWLYKYCDDNRIDIPPYAVHSANPVGRVIINAYLTK